MRLQRFTSIFTALYALMVSTSASIQPNSNPLSPKNVAFGLIGGGSSHTTWVLSILDELASRGHNVTFAAGDGHAHFGSNYEHINTVSISDFNEAQLDTVRQMTHKDWAHAIIIAIGTHLPSYTRDFGAFKSLFQEISADAVLCDFFAQQCIDAANELNLPVIGTLFVGSTPDASAPYVERDWFTLAEPTTLTTSFVTRFYNRYFLTIELMIRLWPPMQQLYHIRRQANLPPLSTDPWKDSLKLVNSMFGLEPARPIGPLVEMIGPIVDSKFSPLTPELERYLDSHSRVALVSFGQHFTPTVNDLHLILGALVENIEKGSIDGFIWAKVNLDSRKLPESILSSSGKLYNVTNIVSGLHPHMRMETWVPQQAILQHHAVSVFLSHGGVGSIYESLLHRVPLVIYPLMSDQPVNARMVEEIGVGKFMDYRVSPKEASAILEMVARDVTGEFNRNTQRYGTVVQIRSAHGSSKGADLVEEVMILSANRSLPHRYEASRQMSYFKATNLDLDIAMVFLVSAMVWLCWRAVNVVKERFRAEIKTKTH